MARQRPRLAPAAASAWLLLLGLALGVLYQPAAAAEPQEVFKALLQTSRIIPSAGSVHLANGNGDVATDKACSKDIKAYCKDIGPGEGRLAHCLTMRLKDMQKGNVDGRRVTKKCLDELAEFKMDRSTNINKDIPLANACKDSALKLCKDKSDEKEPGSILACLRDRKNEVTGNCKVQVFRTQEEAVMDYRTDFKLYTVCKGDVESLCADVEPGGELDCLESKRRDVTWDCQAQVFRAEKEAGDDIRLSVRLFSKCYEDYKRYCKDVEPGHMQVQECLEDNLGQADFSSECKEELDNVLAKRVADFRLNTVLREACAQDLKDHCAATLEEMDTDDKVRAKALNCLQQYKEELSAGKCKEEVHRLMERAARDIRFDQVMADSCYDDRLKYCNDVQMGSARVIRCLQDHRDSLAPACSAALFDHEVNMAESIDFQYPMKKACAWEINVYCKDVPHGHARVIRCLQDNLDESEMTEECKEEVARNIRSQARDFRFNWRLNEACGADIANLCSLECTRHGGGQCGGLVLRCLQDNQDNITDQACQDEVFYYELMEVKDFRNDVILAEACRKDVDTYCKDMKPGEGRVHSCLRFNKDKISDRCRKEEMKLAALEYKDIRLRPKLNKLCSEEKAAFCADVKPGKARVVKCLLENMAHPNFGEECHEEVQKREEAMSSDYRYDIAVVEACTNDIELKCSAEKSKLRGQAAVLKCLVQNFRELADVCQVEMSRAVRLALWDYRKGAPLTAMCDADNEAKCSAGSRSKSGTAFTIGAVGRCLSKALVQGDKLQPACRQLVLVAAPRDVRGYFQGAETTSAVLQRALDLQRAAGLEGVLLNGDAAQTGDNTVTVTGWLALACVISLVVVAVGGAFLLARRFTGAEKPHTLHVKSGDA